MKLEELKCINCGGNEFEIGDFLLCSFCNSRFRVPKEIRKHQRFDYGSSQMVGYYSSSRVASYDELMHNGWEKDSNGNLVNYDQGVGYRTKTADLIKEKLGI
ncbi:MAG: hypothetical protein ACYSR0_00340 [Planctomycetota bacterium]|jgi:hypothetical protein